MKSASKILSLALAVMMLIPSSATALAAEKPELVPSGIILGENDADGIQTVITFENGRQTAVDAPIDVTLTEQNPIIETIEEFEVSYKDETILTVEPHNLASTGWGSGYELTSGYYAVSFAIPDSEKECFLTGLPPANVDTIQEELIESYAAGEDFSLESLRFIDAEKLQDTDADDNLCWAGATSNMLHYSGWGAQAGFQNEDEIFDLFMDSYYDGGSFDLDGLEWFFAGTQGSYNVYESHLKDYPNSGRYLPDYPIDQLAYMRNLRTDCVNGMKQMFSDLRAGNAVGLDVMWLSDGAHALTLWGYITDNAYGEDEKAHYESVILSDSDNNQPEYTSNRHTALNTLDLYHVEEYTGDIAEDSMIQTNGTGVFYEYCSLTPYSKDIQKETSEKATRDKRHSPDLITSGLRYADTAFSADDAVAGIAHSGDVYVYADIMNHSDASADGSFKIDAVILDDDGDKVAENSSEVEIYSGSYYTMSVPVCTAENLEEGVYTAEITLNADEEFEEAFFINNHYTESFTVRDSDTDTSALSLYAEPQDFGSGYGINALLYCDGLDVEEYDKAEYKISYYREGAWQDYSDGEEIDENNALPANVYLNYNGSKVRFKLCLWRAGIITTVLSPVYDLTFPYIRIEETENNVSPATEIANNATQLNEGEQFAFILINNSCGDVASIEGSYRVEAVNDMTGDRFTLIEPTPVELAQGESSGEITVSSWENRAALYGTYTVSVIFEFKDYDTVRDYTLGSIRTKEQRSNIVNTPYDTTDDCDGLTSLREAVSYCQQTGTDEIILHKYISGLTLSEPIEINSDITINGSAIDIYNQSINATIDAGLTRHFIISEGGSLTLKNLILKDGSSEEGGAVLCRGGRLSMVDCVITDCSAERYGGAVAIYGGEALLKNTAIHKCTALFGGAIFTDRNARAELLNTLMYNCTANRSGIIYDASGTVNLINSDILGCYSTTTILTAHGEMNIVNSIILSNSYNNETAWGKAHAYGSALGNDLNHIAADELTSEYQDEDFFYYAAMSRLPVFDYGGNGLPLYPRLKDAVLEGCYTTVKNGEIYLSKDGESYTATGVKTAFTDEELQYDATGNERSAAYGTYCTVSAASLLGDVDGSGEADIVDVTIVQRYDAAMVTLSDEALTAADVDSSGAVDILDATFIQRYVAGMAVSYDIGQPIRD